MTMDKLTHVDSLGKAKMVDIGEKSRTSREARASGFIRLGPTALRLVRENKIAKGDVLNTASIAGIQAAKRTSDLIPLTHPIPLDFVDIETEIMKTGIKIVCRVRTEANTGAEMEAMTGAAAAALTIYDMVKAADKSARITSLQLDFKSGGKSGVYRRKK